MCILWSVKQRKGGSAGLIMSDGWTHNFLSQVHRCHCHAGGCSE